MSDRTPEQKLEWENVEDNLAGQMRRAKVPGGWIYRHDQDVPTSREYGSEWGLQWRTAIVFVPEEATK